MFEWMKRDCWSCTTPDKAVKKVHPGCLEYLFSLGHKTTLISMLTAVANNKPVLIHVFIKYKITPDARVTLAASKVNTELLKYFIGIGYPWNPKIIPIIVLHRDFDFAVCLLKKGFSYDRLEVQMAALKANNLSVLEYFISKDIPFKPELTYYAALAGQLDILAFCIHNCGEVAHDTIYGAVKGNHLRCLTYLSHLPIYHLNNSWRPIAVLRAVESGSYECLIALCKHRDVKTLDVDLLQLIKIAIERDYKEISLYLLALYRAPPAYA